MIIKFQGPTTESACFFCIEPIKVGEEAVLWRGAWTGQPPILLHRKCSAMLGVRLINDGTRGDSAMRSDVYAWLGDK